MLQAIPPRAPSWTDEDDGFDRETFVSDEAEPRAVATTAQTAEFWNGNGSHASGINGKKVPEGPDLFRGLIERVGEDPAREGLLKTPERAWKAFEFMTEGYRQDVGAVLNNAVFHEEYEDLVLVRDIEFYSLCEHHLLPFLGRAHVAYLPEGKVIGLSKIARLVNMFSRRLQVQERLTQEVGKALEEAIQPAGVAVVMEAQHMCMMLRGVQKQSSLMVTSYLSGRFREDARTRAELMQLLGVRG